MVLTVGLLVGSLGQGSSNAAALTVADEYLRDQGHDTRWISGLESVPPFSPSDADDAPVEVCSFREQIEAVDTVLIAAPEYAGGVSGVVKNALDWLVGSASLYHTPIGVMSVGTTGGEHAIEQLIRTLSWQGALVVITLGVGSPRTKSDSDGRISDPSTIVEIRAWVDHVTSLENADPLALREQVRSIIEPYGIDVDRFGDFEKR